MNDENSQARAIASTIVFGALGAGLVYYGRRQRGLLATLATTAGYSLITKAVSSTVLATLAPSSERVAL